jgi:hypothetical protein
MHLFRLLATVSFISRTSSLIMEEMAATPGGVDVECYKEQLRQARRPPGARWWLPRQAEQLAGKHHIFGEKERRTYSFRPDMSLLFKQVLL